MLQNFNIDNTFTPGKVYISAIDIGSRKLGFAWSPATPDCPVIPYNILTSNCGSCPTTTNYTNATCADVPSDGSMCLFVVQPVVCGDTNGTSSYSLTINLTQTFRGTHSKNGNLKVWLTIKYCVTFFLFCTVSLSFLIVGAACLAISVSVIIICYCLYVIKKRNITKPSSR